jgi:hypothetical protein
MNPPSSCVQVKQQHNDSPGAGGSRPTRHRQAGDSLKVGEVVGHQRRGKGEGMCGNQQVHGADCLAGSFQLVPDATVVRGTGRAVVIEHFEGRQDLFERLQSRSAEA